MRGALGILVCVLALGCAAAPARRFTAAPTGELGDAARTGGFFTREAAVAELRRRGAEGAADLAALVRDGVRLDHATLVFVTQNGDDVTNAAVVRVLGEELRTAPWWHQSAVLKALGRVPPDSPGLPEAVRPALSAGDADVCLRAARILGRTPYDGPDATLCRHLAAQTQDVTRTMLFVLDVPHLGSGHKQCGLGHSSSPSREDVDAAIELLRPALRAELSRLRALGLTAAAAILDDPDAAGHLAHALTESSPRMLVHALRLVIWRAANSLEDGRPELKARLSDSVKALRDHADPRVRGWAAVAFGELHDLVPPASITLQYLESEDHELRERCLWLLRASDLDASAIPALLEALKRTDSQGRWVLMQLIYRIGPAAAEPLRRALPDIRNPNARADAARLLAWWDRVEAEHR